MIARRANERPESLMVPDDSATQRALSASI